MICHWRWWRLCWWGRSWCYVRLAYIFDWCVPDPGSVNVMLLPRWPPCAGTGVRLWLAGQNHPLLSGSSISWGNWSNVFPVCTAVMFMHASDWNNVFQQCWTSIWYTAMRCKNKFIGTLLVHGQVTIIFVVSVCLSVCLFVCLSVCLCRVFFSRLRSDLDQTRTHVTCPGLVVSPRIYGLCDPWGLGDP